MSLTPGSWVVQATAQFGVFDPDIDELTATRTDCELRVNSTDFIGGGTDERLESGFATIPVNGGVFIPQAFAFVDLFCRHNAGIKRPSVRVEMVAIQVGGFI